MLKIKQLNVSYGKHIALHSMDLEIADGQFVGIMGPNGGGKSSLFKALLELTTYSGDIQIDDKSNRKQIHRIAYLPQRQEIDKQFPITVEACIRMGAYHAHQAKEKNTDDQVKKRLNEVLELVDLSAFRKRQISQLSGGQFQRMMVARCMIQDADYILLDEPLVGVDFNSEAMIIKILKELAEKGKTILMVHHDLHTASTYFDQVVLVNRTCIAQGPPQEILDEKTILKAFLAKTQAKED